MLSEKPNITIANINDAGLLTNLSVTTFWATFAAYNKQEDMHKYVTEEISIEKISSELLDEQNIFLLVHYDQSPVGFVKLSIGEKPKQLTAQNPLEISRLYVLKEYHYKKLGAALMQHCIDFAMERRHDVIWLGVWEHNTSALSFYKRWGFEFFGSHIFRLGNDDQTDLLMKKEIGISI